MILPRELYLLPIYLFSRIAPRFWHHIQNRFVSYAMYRIWRSKSEIIQKNLSVILGRSPLDPFVKAMSRRFWHLYGYYMMDYVQLNRVNRPGNQYLIPDQKGTIHIRNALEEGRGGILITPHLGNWELGGIAFALKGCPIHALTLKNTLHRVQVFRDRMRSTLGIQSVHVDPSRYDTVLKLARLLKENNFVAMLGDRWEGGKSSEVTFFGRKVVFPAGAAALALATGSPIIPVYTIIRPRGHYLAWAEPPIRVEKTPGTSSQEIINEKTQEIASAFERAVSRYPDQWFHFFDYWSRYAC